MTAELLFVSFCIIRRDPHRSGLEAARGMVSRLFCLAARLEDGGRVVEMCFRRNDLGKLCIDVMGGV